MGWNLLFQLKQPIQFLYKDTTRKEEAENFRKMSGVIFYYLYFDSNDDTMTDYDR
jgi:hypothetical protein